MAGVEGGLRLPMKKLIARLAPRYRALAIPTMLLYKTAVNNTPAPVPASHGNALLPISFDVAEPNPLAAEAAIEGAPK